MANKRHEKIKSLIEEFEISTQEELTDRLNEAGFDVSQATVSRDIKKLNLIKAEGASRKIKYVIGNVNQESVPDKILELFKHVTLSIKYANNLIIIKTLTGNGSSVGMAIDKMAFNEILGTVAGDDTLLIVTKSENDAKYVVNCLRAL